MSKGIVGRKVGMTQIFDDVGNRVPVTLIDVSGSVVVQKKSKHGKDGYSAVKLGFGSVHKLEKEGTEPKFRLAKPRVGVFLKAGIAAPRRHLIEVRVAESALDKYEVGQELTADLFAAGDWVDVTGTSKGVGFAGVMKRHNFAGTKGSHGAAHETHRHGGSIGQSATPGRVMPGKKMAGHMGNERVTIQNIRIVKVLSEDNIIVVKGGIPGPNGGVVLLRTAVKKTVA